MENSDDANLVLSACTITEDSSQLTCREQSPLPEESSSQEPTSKEGQLPHKS